MKNTLTLSSLVLIGGYASIEIARLLGVHIPDTLNGSYAFIAFTLTLLGLIALADYGPKARPIALPRTRAFTPTAHQRSVAAAYRHVYAIRRGNEAARLAKPPHIVVFPRHSADRLNRAA